MTENTRPVIVPIAKSNQKTSEGPSKRKGTRPIIDESMVSDMGIIFLLNALTYALSCSCTALPESMPGSSSSEAADLKPLSPSMADTR